MAIRLVCLAGLISVALGAGAPAALAQGGPAERPPVDFAGRQFVDSRGCVFVRAPADRSRWVPRRAADGVPLCGFRPTLAGRASRVPFEAVEAPFVPPPRPSSQPSLQSAGPERRAAPKTAPEVQRRRSVPPAAIRPVPPPEVPTGYARVWQDDRLNPARGRGTPEGEAQMAMVWSDTVPRRLVPAETVRLSTASRPARQRYVQVGAFAVAENARRTAQRLTGMGLPAGQGQVVARGTPLTVVFAGPFNEQARLDQALARLRQAGFTEVFLRN